MIVRTRKIKELSEYANRFIIPLWKSLAREALSRMIEPEKEDETILKESFLTAEDCSGDEDEQGDGAEEETN